MKQDNINMFLCKNQGKFKNEDLIKIQRSLEQIDDRYFPLLMCTSYNKRIHVFKVLSGIAFMVGLALFVSFIDFFNKDDLKTVIVGVLSVLALLYLLFNTLANERTVNFIEFQGFIKSISPNSFAAEMLKK